MTIIRPLPTIELALCAERAVWWADQKTLFVADLHLGRSAVASAGEDTVLVQSLNRMRTLISRYHADRVVILGDMFHMKRHYNQDLLRMVFDWRASLDQTQFLLVRGNHERVLGDPPEALQITCVDPGYTEHGLMFLHEPRVTAQYTLCAHLHPNILVPSLRVAAEACRVL